MIIVKQQTLRVFIAWKRSANFLYDTRPYLFGAHACLHALTGSL